MNGADNIIPLMQSLVDQMTPVITIETNVVDGINWKLTMCKTQWLTSGKTISIGGIDYKIESFIFNDHIIISGPSQPVVTTFQLLEPIFRHGSHRKVNAEFENKKDLTREIVYLPVPEVTEDNRYDSDIVYTANIKPLFLRTFKTAKDNINFQQVDVIEPMNAMADFFISLINSQDDKFNRPSNIVKKEWMNFGNPTIWGNDKLIFNQPLSGVERRFNLEVLPDGVCECDDAPVVTCAPVQFYLNGLFEKEIASGEEFKATVVDTNDDPVVATFDDITNKITVPVSGGGSTTLDVSVNGVLFYDDVSTDQNVPVKNTALTNLGSKIGANWIIPDMIMPIYESPDLFTPVAFVTIIAGVVPDFTIDG